MIKKLFALAAVVALVVLSVAVAYAHDHRDVGEYEFTVGFIVEPAFEGLKNGVDLRVAHHDTEEPVVGLENTLQVEVTHVATGVSKTMRLRTIFNDPGHYTADLIPTSPGQYRFRFFGTVNGMEVNETFESGPGRFNDIQPITDLYFPEGIPAARELQSAVRGSQTAATQAQNAALEAKDRASSASTMGIIGIVLGAAGIAFGAGAAAIALRRR